MRYTVREGEWERDNKHRAVCGLNQTGLRIYRPISQNAKSRFDERADAQFI